MSLHTDNYRHPYSADPPRRPRFAVLEAPPELPPEEPDTQVAERLQQIREISHRAIGSIDDLLKRTA
ncbi:hypothetical protein ACBI99_43275 [Nonomuraea sp. ATR24]|uniref:hypothetical protein n=1 Tax=Nonomuraea TaxID=83681 RepID=UPI001C5EB04C|nr:hypothetical protein [Nonomuraea ceibae]